MRKTDSHVARCAVCGVACLLPRSAARAAASPQCAERAPTLGIDSRSAARRLSNSFSGFSRQLTRGPRTFSGNARDLCNPRRRSRLGRKNALGIHGDPAASSTVAAPVNRAAFRLRDTPRGLGESRPDWHDAGTGGVSPRCSPEVSVSDRLDPQKQRQFAVEAVRTLRGAGFAAYWAGGCVRDCVLGRTPKDYDVATNAPPPQIRVLFGRKRTLPLGAAFGVITVLGPPGAGAIEVATFRRDAEYRDGRHPDSVTFSTAEEDAARRDFTINGMFYDPIEDRLIDFVGGQRDLEARSIRAIGDPQERFREDKLRLLRAVRFAAALQAEIEPSTEAAIRRMAAEITVVSAERIAVEMQRILVDPHRSRGIRLLARHRTVCGDPAGDRDS